jgi:hypothetical protein
MRCTGSAIRLVLGGVLLAGCVEPPLPSSPPEPRMTGTILINLIRFGIATRRITFSIPLPRTTISADKEGWSP